jgi:ribosomal protein S18 acetylase RimI-like enzyme
MTDMPSTRIYPATTGGHVEDARTLFREYAASLNISLCFQGFETELAGLPGKYAPPSGCLLLAGSNSQLAGCVAVRPIEGDACEMKRLFVRPEFRGLGLGRQLAVDIISQARSIGYRIMRLDTLETLKPAIALYETLGFKTITAYYENPLPGVVYLELKL